MPNQITALTVVALRKIQPNPGRKGPHLVCDGNGLYLQIMPGGSSRSFVFRYTKDGRARSMGLGSIDRTSLSEARKLAVQLKATLHRGVDPLAALAKEKAQTEGKTHRMTFKKAAQLYIATHRPSWSSDKHADQWSSTLERYAYPVLGALPVADISVIEIRKVLDPIWSTINETASRLRGRMEKILAWATVQGYRTGDNPARWTGFLSEVLLKRSAVAAVTHHAAVAYDAAPAVYREARNRSNLASQLLQVLMLTAVRTTEARAALWDEIDFGTMVWTVPAKRMKSRRIHRVPLSPEVADIFRALAAQRARLPEDQRSPFVFPGAGRGTCLSNMAALVFLQKGLGFTEATPHGMRATFRTWVAECTSYPRELAEAALAHVLSDKVEAAYQRGDMLEKRRKLMEAWASHLTGTGPLPAQQQA